MPLYEYHCANCKQDFELLIRGEEQPECPALCQQEAGETAQRLRQPEFF